MSGIKYKVNSRKHILAERLDDKSSIFRVVRMTDKDYLNNRLSWKKVRDIFGMSIYYEDLIITDETVIHFNHFITEGYKELEK